MSRRLLAFFLCFALVAGCCLPAQAEIASLDRVLSGWIGEDTAVRFSASMQVNAMLPFTDDTLALLNGVLKHVTVDASVTGGEENASTEAQIAVDGATLLNWTQQAQGGTYTFATSLLPNRTLTSALGSPMDILTGADSQTAETDAAEAEASDAQQMNASNAEEAFATLDAITEAQGCYQALTDGIKAFATEKKASYKIKNIGKCTWSRIARLTAEQSDGLLAELRAIISCGMDDEYRAEIAQMTFEKGFIVALYRNADGQDMSVYLKGNVAYPDGSRRKLLWQWSFVTNGLKRTDIFKFEASRTAGKQDTRTVAAACTQENKSGSFSLDAETEATLKRSRVTDKCTDELSLSGTKAEDTATTCKGNVNRTVTQTASGETVRNSDAATVDLQLTPDGTGGNLLSGTVVRSEIKDKTVVNELTWTFAATAATAAVQPTETPEPESGITVSIIQPENTAEADNAAGSAPVSSLEQFAANSESKATQDEQDAASSPYLVGALPSGVKEYTVPDQNVVIDLDTADADTLQNLLAEAAQNLAGRMILAIAELPEEDAALLKDGMTDEDYAAFLALLDAM
ncbi:MAG: hypothetical protein PHY64_06115 [Eubacteriales bacterium]|nr:hypothetical protein [Eubacteriales bacterium]